MFLSYYGYMNTTHTNNNSKIDFVNGATFTDRKGSVYVASKISQWEALNGTKIVSGYVTVTNGCNGWGGEMQKAEWDAAQSR